MARARDSAPGRLHLAKLAPGAHHPPTYASAAPPTPARLAEVVLRPLHAVAASDVASVAEQGVVAHALDDGVMRV
eukprot:1088486-Pyramimonas_sp.AAC.2